MNTTDDSRKQRCFIYCRTSTDAENADDSDKVSIEEQELNGRALAKKHGLQVVDVFVDRNRSSRVYPTGYTMPTDTAVEAYCRQCNFSAKQRTRDALGEMIARLDEVGTVIVRDQDRLMRPLTLSYLDTHLLNLFKNAGIVILSRGDEIIDPSNSRHVTHARNQSSNDGENVARRIIDTRDALRSLRDSGMPYFSTSFFGFRYAASKKPPTRIEAEIEVVRRIYRDFIALNNIGKIVRALNAEGVPSPTTHVDKNKVKATVRFWNISTVRNILRRTQYAGFHYRTDGTEVETPFFHPPVIEREIFDQVQAIFERRSYDPQGCNREIHALTGLLKCGYCHYNMEYNAVVQKGVKRSYYHCKKVKDTAGKTGCSTTSIRERVPDALVRKKLKSTKVVHGIEDCLYPLIYKGIYDLNLASQRRDGLQQEILDVEKKLIRLREKVLEADSEDFTKLHGKAAAVMLVQRTKQYTDAGERREQLQRELDVCDFEALPIPSFEDFANIQIDSVAKKLFFSRVIDHVDVFADRVDIYLKEPDERSITLFREYVNGSWLLPRWELIPADSSSFEFADMEDDNPKEIKRVFFSRRRRTKGTQYNILYRYQLPGPIHTVYGDTNQIIAIQGLPARRSDRQSIPAPNPKKNVDCAG